MTPSWYMHPHACSRVRTHVYTHAIGSSGWGEAGCSVTSELCDRELEASGALWVRVLFSPFWLLHPQMCSCRTVQT